MSNETPHNPQRISRSAKNLPEGVVESSYPAGACFLKEQLDTLPDSSGVYRMISGKNEVLYVGKAKNLKKRVASYTQRARLPVRLQRMVALTRHLDIVVTHTETEALLLEANLIRHYQPPFNVLLKDDKSYPYILITKDHDFPQIVKYRGSKDQQGWYYGPFASVEAVTETMLILMRGFQLRNCSNSIFNARKRPCLQYHIKRCTAPCVHKVSKTDYAQQVTDARHFLTGRNVSVLADLQNKMQEASAAQHYEKAAEMRDRIKIISAIHSKQTINLNNLGDVDVVALHRESGHASLQVFFFRNDRNYGNRAYFPNIDDDVSDGALLSTFLAQFYADKPAPKLILLSHETDDEALLTQALSDKEKSAVAFHVPKLGDKKRLIDMALANAREALARRLADKKNQGDMLEGVARIFNLDEPPQRIEVYDNSHTGGTHAIGAMIVAGPDGFIKKAYRQFNMKGAMLKAGDDFGMMREMLTRRFARALDEDTSDKSWGREDWPDLLLIDGGQGQLNAALAVLDELDISDIPVIGIAKGPDRNAGRERFFMPGRKPFSLEPRDPVLYYLQRLRDEAHRFAIGTHRARRAKSITASPLDAIEGIGPARKKKLLLHFGSAQGVARAGLEDLKRAGGISAAMAKKIYAHFNEG